MAKLNFFSNRNSESEEEDPGAAIEKKFGETDKKITEFQTETKSTLSSIAEGLKAVNERFAREDAEREKAEKARKDAEARKAAEADNSRTAEEEAELMLTDPKKYIASQTLGATKLALIATAKQLRDETLSEKEYYHGEFKKKVDFLIDNEPNLQLRANPQFINNCYKVILADHMDQITKGELKTRAAMYSFAGGGTSGKSGTENDGKVTVEYEDAKSRFAANSLGLTDEDVVKASKEKAIKGLEVIA